jgi:hypothetical protein
VAGACGRVAASGAARGGASEGEPLIDANGCPAECRAALADGDGILLSRTGDPGISPEWVLRMPAGRAFDLGSRAITTHDILSEKPRRLPVSFRRVDNVDTPDPALIRVTLVDVCAADIQFAESSHLRFAEHAIIPIPTGFRKYRWVQLSGCGPLASLPDPSTPVEAQ